MWQAATLILIKSIIPLLLDIVMLLMLGEKWSCIVVYAAAPRPDRSPLQQPYIRLKPSSSPMSLQNPPSSDPPRSFSGLLLARIGSSSQLGIRFSPQGITFLLGCEAPLPWIKNDGEREREKDTGTQREKICFLFPENYENNKGKKNMKSFW